MDLIGIWWDRLAAALQHPAFHAAFLAMLVGIAVTEALAWILPRRLEARVAERIIRVVVIIVVTWLGFLMHKTTIGAGWAFFAGCLAPSTHHSLQAFIYRRWPKLRPRALR